MIVEAAASTAAGVFNAVFTGILATIVATAGLITAVKAPRVARRNKAIDDTADHVRQIHILVDGNLTAAKEAELNATRRELVTLKEVNRLHVDAGHDVDPEARAEIARTALRITALETEIVERRAVDTATDSRTKEQS